MYLSRSLPLASYAPFAQDGDYGHFKIYMTMVKYCFRFLLAFLLCLPTVEAFAQWQKGSYPNLDAITRRDAILQLRDSLEQARPNDPRNKLLGAVHVPKAWLDNYQSLCRSLNENSRVLYRTWDGRYALVASFYTNSQSGDETAQPSKYPVVISPSCSVPKLGVSALADYLDPDADTLTPYPIKLSDHLWQDMQGNKQAASYRPFSYNELVDTSVAAFYSVDLSRKATSKLLLYTYVGTHATAPLKGDKSHLVPLASVPDEDAGDGYTCAIDSLAPSQGGAVLMNLQTLLLRLDGAVLSKQFLHNSRGASNILVHKDRSIYTIIEDKILLADSNYYEQPITYDIAGRRLGEGALISRGPSEWPISYGFPEEPINPATYFLKIPAQLKKASKLEVETAILGLGKPISEYADLFSVLDTSATTPSDQALYHTASYRSDATELPNTSGSGSILVRVNVVGYYGKALVTEEGDLLTFMPFDFDGEAREHTSDINSEYEGQLLLRIDPNYVTELRKKTDPEADDTSKSQLDKHPYNPARSYFFTSTDVARPERKQLRKVSKPQGSHFTIKGAVIVYKVGEPNSTSDN